ncbi:MAG TPA: hypothetical protein DGG95_15595 [Cytophagales bacterium]|jgi:hypothetical protein|nr:hypothetical protein [Cytophagales bacterium]
MKTKIKIFTVISIGFCSLIINCYGQQMKNVDRDSLTTVTVKCINDSLMIKIPSGQYKTQKTNYVEGFIFSIVYSDGSHISILCGHDAELNIGEMRGSGLFARKSEVKGRKIIYENVKQERVNIFNKAFDLLK